jgi:hypothetical protein
METKSAAGVSHSSARATPGPYKLIMFFILAYGTTWIFRFVPLYAQAEGWIKLPSWAGYIIYACLFGPSIGGYLLVLP